MHTSLALSIIKGPEADARRAGLLVAGGREWP